MRIGKMWWRQQDSNLWPHGCEPCALTNWAMPPYNAWGYTHWIWMRLWFVHSLTSSFCFLFAFYAGFLISLFLAEVTDDAVTSAFSLKTTDSVFQAFVFADFNCRHLIHLLENGFYPTIIHKISSMSNENATTSGAFWKMLASSHRIKITLSYQCRFYIELLIILRFYCFL